MYNSFIICCYIIFTIYNSRFKHSNFYIWSGFQFHPSGRYFLHSYHFIRFDSTRHTKIPPRLYVPLTLDCRRTLEAQGEHANSRTPRWKPRIEQRWARNHRAAATCLIYYKESIKLVWIFIYSLIINSIECININLHPSSVWETQTSDSKYLI